jgi:hypothetical protein
MLAGELAAAGVVVASGVPDPFAAGVLAGAGGFSALLHARALNSIKVETRVIVIRMVLQDSVLVCGRGAHRIMILEGAHV